VSYGDAWNAVGCLDSVFALRDPLS